MHSEPQWLTFDLADAAKVGGKAASLAKLQALGLRVPPAVVITDQLVRAWIAPEQANDSPAELERCRRAIEAGSFPASFELALTSALKPMAVSRWSV